MKKQYLKEAIKAVLLSEAFPSGDSIANFNANSDPRMTAGRMEPYISNKVGKNPRIAVLKENLNYFKGKCPNVTKACLYIAKCWQDGDWKNKKGYDWEHMVFEGNGNTIIIGNMWGAVNIAKSKVSFDECLKQGFVEL